MPSTTRRCERRSTSVRQASAPRKGGSLVVSRRRLSRGLPPGASAPGGRGSLGRPSSAGVPVTASERLPKPMQPVWGLDRARLRATSSLMSGNVSRVLVLAAALAVAGCASEARPVLYPNDHLSAVGQAQADADLAECRRMAETAGASGGEGRGEGAARGTAVGGAIGGATGAVGGAI